MLDITCGSTAASPSLEIEWRRFAKSLESEGFRCKKIYDINTKIVNISTIHSVKGLDYSVVFLLGLDFLEPREWSEDQLNRLTYVAITRAHYELFIPYKRKSELIKKLMQAL